MGGELAARAWGLGLILYLFGLLVFLVDVEDALGNGESAGVILVTGMLGLLFMLIGTITLKSGLAAGNNAS